MLRAAVFLAFAAMAAARHDPAIAQDSPRMLDTESGPVSVEVLAGGLEHPWGAVLLPDGDMLVTERPGRLRLVSAEGAVGEPIEGVPDVFAQGQGGLLDVALDPDFATNGEEVLSLEARVRDLLQASDGSVLALIDAASGRILRLRPAN